MRCGGFLGEYVVGSTVSATIVGLWSEDGNAGWRARMVCWYTEVALGWNEKVIVKFCILSFCYRT